MQHETVILPDESEFTLMEIGITPTLLYCIYFGSTNTIELRSVIVERLWLVLSSRRRGNGRPRARGRLAGQSFDQRPQNAARNLLMPLNEFGHF